MTRERFGLRAWIDLRARLWLVMVFVLLPALAYIAVSSLLSYQRARAQAQSELLAEARLAGSAEQRSLDEMQRSLALAAGWPALRAAAQASGAAACQASLSQLAGLYPQALGFGLWRLNGDSLCAEPALSSAANVAGKTWFRQVVAQRTFAVGDFEQVTDNSPPIIEFGYPLTNTAGELAGVLSAWLDLRQLTSAGAQPALPEDALLVVLDHNGLVLARSQDAAGALGKPEAGDLAGTLGESSGESEQTGADGLRRVYAFTPVPGPGGNLVYLSVARPAADVFGQAGTALVTSLVIAAGLAVLALILAGWWAQQTVLRPLNGLLRVAERLADGDLAARAQPELTNSQLDQLAAAVNTLGARLAQGDADHSRAQAQLHEAEQQARAAAEQATALSRQAQARAAQLETVAAGLSGALTAAEVIHVILQQGAGAVGATAATLLVLSTDGTWLKQAASVGYSDQIGRLFQQYPVASPLPPADVVRTGEPVWLESSAAYRARYPQLTEVINALDYEGAAALPLRYAGRITGVLTLSFPNTLSFSGDLQSYLLTLASFCAQALERIRLYEATQQKR